MNIPDQQLSEHFRLVEFVRSQRAQREGFDNTPPPWVIDNLRRLAAYLEEVRDLLGDNAIQISSGYRCPELNHAVGSKPTSAHIEGRAADFECPDFGTPLEICQAIAGSDLQFDQLILEFQAWTHNAIPVAGEPPRRQVLTIDRNGTRIGLPI